MEELKTERPMLVFFLVHTKPLQSYSVLVKSRSQTLQWWATGGWGKEG
jgi:hypothetical protein